MYYVDGDRTLRRHYCFSPGPPTWSWNDFKGLDAALAPLSASIVPGTDQLLEATQRLLDDQRQRLDDQLARFWDSLQEEDVSDDDYAMRNEIPYDDDLYDRSVVNYID